MNLMHRRAGASIALAAALLPICVFAAPVRVQVSRCESSVTDAPELSTERIQERTTFGLKKAAPLDPNKSTVAPSADSADVLVIGKLSRNGPKFRLLYLLQTRQEPKLRTQLVYEFASARLSDKGATSMGQDIIKAAVALEEARLTRSSGGTVAATSALPTPTTVSHAPTVAAAPEPQVAPAIATAPVTTAAPVVATTPAPTVAPAPAPAAQDTYASYAEEPSFKPRRQPVAVIHMGLLGMMGMSPTTYGGGATLEPKWNITDNIAAGIRLDAGAAIGSSVDDSGGSGATAAAAATLLKGEYLVGDSGIRPFVGLGAGMYVLANQAVAVNTEGGAGVAQSGGTFFGVAPQLGIDFGGARLAVSYNHILGADVLVEQSINAGIEPTKIKRNYFLLELSFRIAKFGKVSDPNVADGY
ncbi:hypothetical protein P2318_20110 [Myxococcaceae bacterium GXIMD 01537]